MAACIVDTNITVDNLSIESQSISIPTWLNIDFLLKHLQKHFNDAQLQIDNFEVKCATAKGENYASSIYRALLRFIDEQKSIHNLNIIVKTALPGDFALKILSGFDVYNKEIDFYKRIAPQIEMLCKKLNDTSQLLPKTYGVSGTNKAMLFEDLILKGYRLWPVHRGFDIAGAKMLLTKAATLHACCAILQQQQPNVFENFKHGIISRDSDGLNTFYLTQFDAVIEVISAWSDFAVYTEKFQRLREHLIENGRKAFDADPEHFNTMIHGDMWCNNIMVKYFNCSENNEKTILENMIYLDFQYSCWTSPTIDLHYFLNTSLNETVRTNHMDELIEFYHEHLIERLMKLNYQKHIPTLNEFRKQYRDKSFYGFIASCLVQPIMINENTENADFDALVLGDERSKEFKRVMYSSSKAQANLRKLIPFYDRLGVFD